MKAIIKIWSSLMRSKAVKHPTKNIWEMLRKDGRETRYLMEFKLTLPKIVNIVAKQIIAEEKIEFILLGLSYLTFFLFISRTWEYGLPPATSVTPKVAANFMAITSYLPPLEGLVGFTYLLRNALL